MRAEWIEDYDLATDSLFSRPGCPECYAPVGLEDGRYLCYSCGEEFEIDDEMVAWFEIREGEKLVKEECFECHGENTMETHYSKNPVTLEWQAMGGRCKKCGIRFIV